MNIEVNYLAVLLAGIAGMVVGFVWYSPLLFAKPWMKLMGHTKESMKANASELNKIYSISFVLSLLTAFVLSHVMTMSMNYFHYPALTTGATSAFWMWLGFIMPVQLTDLLFGNKKMKLFAINTGYQLAALLVTGIVLGLL